MEEKDDEITIDAYCRRPFLQIFWPPDKYDWRVDASYPEGYYQASKYILEGVVNGTLREGIEGVAALFLFRHYLELQLKYIIFHARWMRKWNNNADDTEIQAVGKGHSLNKLWDEMQRECTRRIPKTTWDSFDTEFVEKYITEFHNIDPEGECFRYASKLIQVDHSQIQKYPLGISFQSILATMDHLYFVLDWIDRYLLNKYGENEEWEEIQNSF